MKAENILFLLLSMMFIILGIVIIFIKFSVSSVILTSGLFFTLGLISLLTIVVKTLVGKSSHKD